MLVMSYRIFVRACRRWNFVGSRRMLSTQRYSVPVVFGMRRGHTEIRQSSYQCLAYVAQLHDNGTAFKTPQHIPNTARIPLQSRAIGQVSSVKYYFFSFWANKLRFLAKLPPIVKSEQKIAGSFWVLQQNLQQVAPIRKSLLPLVKGTVSSETRYSF
jgi:hypothetical protein